jgi:hypothetical protein
MFKKNVFENFQKVALNMTVMDDISHQILQKLNYALCHFCGILNVSLWLTMYNFLFLKINNFHQDICAMYYVLPLAKP